MQKYLAALVLLIALFVGAAFAALSVQNSNANANQNANTNANANSTASDPGDPAVKVWVNKTSHIYHCPGSRSYGTTKNGEYMTQKEAQDAGNRPANKKVCK
jgi:hypothetical protein